MYALQQDQDQAHESIQLREKDAKRREAYAVTSRFAGTCTTIDVNHHVRTVSSTA
jgi:hypothetical protein